MIVGSSLQACLEDKELIQRLEAPVNYMPGNSRSVCWGCIDKDMQKYLGLDYDHFAQYDLSLTEEQCDTMFNAKLDYTRQEVQKLFPSGTEKICECALASFTDVAYDVSPELIDFDLRDFIMFTQRGSYYQAAESLNDSFWCINNPSRCSSDKNQITNDRCVHPYFLQ